MIFTYLSASRVSRMPFDAGRRPAHINEQALQEQTARGEPPFGSHPLDFGIQDPTVRAAIKKQLGLPPFNKR